MNERPASGGPAVSVVIIFLNAEKFLQEAIESVLAQTFTDWELFLVDDGSSDRSTEIARSYEQRLPGKVIYLEHDGHVNKGMTASRNLGIAHAKGEFVAPLDADDVWFPDKLEKQVRILAAHPEAVLAAAPAMYWYADGKKTLQPMTLAQGILEPGAWIPRILERDDNTACPSAVLIRTAALRSVGGFESSFKGPLMVFEDQVLWFKLTLSAPVYFHPDPVLLYRIHAASVLRLDALGRAVVRPIGALRAARGLHSIVSRSGPPARTPARNGEGTHRRADTPDGAASARRGEGARLQRVGRSAGCGRAPHARAARRFHRQGKSHHDVQKDLRSAGHRIPGRRVEQCHDAAGPGGERHAQRVPTLASQPAGARRPSELPAMTTLDMTMQQSFLKRTVKAVVPDGAWESAKRLKVRARGVRSRILMGRDIEPLSYLWGFDRGLPLNRYYIERFLEEFRGDIRGHCLEFQDSPYTRRYGGDAVTKLDILHIDDSQPQATIVADLTKPNDIPTGTFDCIICTQVLHVIFEVDKAVSELHRILKPGGVLLATVPHISMCDPGWHEIWRFTPEGLGAVVGRAFGHESLTVRAYGNSLTAAGELRGLVTDEFSQATLEHHDPRFAISVCVRAVKPPAQTHDLQAR